MNCTNCNAPLESDAKFCGECGQPVATPSVGPSSDRVCTRCGADLESSFQFCGECGQPISQGSPPEPPPIEPPPVDKTLSPPAVPEVTPPKLKEEPPTPAPSAAPTVMASPAKLPAPPVQHPPIASPVAQAAASRPQPPPKKKRSGCVIALIVLAALVVCCSIGGLVGWFILDNASLDFSSSGMDLPILDQLLDGNYDIPPLDWIMGDKISITFENESGLDVCMIAVTPSYSLDFSENVLGDDGFLFAGDTFTTYVDSWLNVNLLVLDCYGEPIYESYEFFVSNEDVLISLTPP